MAAPSEHAEIILALYAAGLGPTKIAKQIGRSKETVRTWLIRHGAYEKGRRGGRQCTLPVNRIRALHAQGMGPWAIARAIQRDRNTVYVWMVRTGLHQPYMSPTRTVSRAIKRGALPDELVSALQALPTPHPPTKIISDLSGYAMSTIRAWLNGTRKPRGQALEDLLATLKKITAAHARRLA